MPDLSHKKQCEICHHLESVQSKSGKAGGLRLWSSVAGSVSASQSCYSKRRAQPCFFSLGSLLCDRLTGYTRVRTGLPSFDLNFHLGTVAEGGDFSQGSYGRIGLPLASTISIPCSVKERERHSRPFCGIAYSRPSIVTVFFSPSPKSH